MSLSGIIDRLDDWINPIVIKELRQAVKSRVVSSVLLLFLGLQMLIVAVFLTFREVAATDDFINGRFGQELFMVLQAILLGACLVLIPAYASLRLSSERSDTNVDLLFISTLRPTSIIAGKLLSALVLAVLVFSCCAPFITFAYLLRGIDIPSILLILGLDLLAAILFTQASLLLASISASRVFKTILFIIAFLLLCCIYADMIGTTNDLLHVGGRYSARNSEFWTGIGLITLAVLLTTGLLFCWSVALISPPLANRALMGRLFLVSLWFILSPAYLGLTLWYSWDAYFGYLIPLTIWMGGSVLLFCIQFLISINERDSYSLRVARTIPHGKVLRCLAFLFYSGSAGGVLLAVLCVALALLIGWGWREAFSTAAALHYPNAIAYADICDTVWWILVAMALYTFCYGMSASFLRTYLFRDKNHSVFHWALCLLLLLSLGCTLPWTVAFITYSGDLSQPHVLPWWKLCNPFWAIYEISAWQKSSLDWKALKDPFHFFCAIVYRIGAWSSSRKNDFNVVCFVSLGAWALSLTVLSVPWAAKQIARFRPHSPRLKNKEFPSTESLEKMASVSYSILGPSVS